MPLPRITIGVPRRAAAGLLLLGLLLPVSSPRGEPYIAVREGLKCSACHVNMTGGGKRNRFGADFGQTRLTGSDAPEGKVFSGQLNPFIGIGGDLRAGYYAQSIPNNPGTSEFMLREGQIYLEVALIPEEIVLYLDQQVAPGAAFARESFALFKGFAGNSYVKAGRFFLPYGWRLEDDSAYIRSIPQLNMETPDTGLEIGHEPGAFSFQLAITNGTAGGNEDNQSKQATLRGSWVANAGRIGASYSRNKDAAETRRTAYNLFGGFRASSIAFLAEADVLKEQPLNGPEIEQLASLAEINWLLAPGMNLKLSYDWNDPDRNVAENERQRTSVIFEPFLRRFTQLRIGLRIAESIPQNDLENADDLFAELHLFF